MPNFPINDKGLIFGFLSQDLVENLGPQSTVKSRASAIETLENKLIAILNPTKIFEIKPYIDHFFMFLEKLMKDQNFKVSVTSIRILCKKL